MESVSVGVFPLPLIVVTVGKVNPVTRHWPFVIAYTSSPQS